MNALARIVSRINFFAPVLRPRLLTLLMGRLVPFVGTAGVRIEQMDSERVVASLKNRRRVRNHIRSLHAAAMALAAETASGFLVAMNLPEDKLPLMKSLRVDFTRRAAGGLRVSASLSPEQRERMQSEERGEVDVLVEAIDDLKQSPIRCQMIWAWVPKKKD